MKMLDIPAAENNKERRIVVEGGIYQKKNWPKVFYDLLPASLVRTLIICEEGPLPFRFWLLRVLSNAEVMSPEDIFHNVNLRYLNWSLKRENLYYKLPSAVSLLWNVQTVIFNLGVEAPSEIWYMRQLRHLQFTRIVLPGPPPPSEKVEQQDDDVLLPNLQTLSTLVNFSFTERVCKRIPNIKKLCIEYDDEECKKKCYYDLSHLHKLQSLYYYFDKVPKRGEFLQGLVLPRSLRKLSLYRCGLHWEDINTIGLSLHHLEFLKLVEDAAVGDEWDCVEGTFPRLKFLRIEFGDLMKWTAESSEFFPVLEKLYLDSLLQLERIPSCMGDIQTLASLGVHWCSVSAAISSVEILEEQLSLGNDDLQLVVDSFYDSDDEEEKLMKESIIEIVEKKNFASKNFKFR